MINFTDELEFHLSYTEGNKFSVVEELFQLFKKRLLTEVSTDTGDRLSDMYPEQPKDYVARKDGRD